MFYFWAFLKHTPEVLRASQKRTVRKPAHVVSQEDLLVDFCDFKNSGLVGLQPGGVKALTTSCASAAQLQNNTANKSSRRRGSYRTGSRDSETV